MNRSSTPEPITTEPLVHALATRLRRADLIGWAQITARAEELGLNLEDLRLLLALTTTTDLSSMRDLARVSGLSLDAAYPAIHHLHGRGYVREDRRQYSLSEEGWELVAILDTAHLEGVRAYVDQLDPRERQALSDAFRDQDGQETDTPD